jgi:hypothetical protein
MKKMDDWPKWFNLLKTYLTQLSNPFGKVTVQMEVPLVQGILIIVILFCFEV